MEKEMETFSGVTFNFYFARIWESGGKVKYLKQREVLFYRSSLRIKS